MTYIFVEDSTSGFDFIKTIVERVITPKKPYKVISLYGCGNLENCVTSILCCDEFKLSDTFIFYIDNYMSTLNSVTLLGKLVEADYDVYVVDYFCFESVFYSYNYQGYITGDVNYLREYKDMRDMLLNKDSSKWSNFYSNYRATLNLGTSCTMEQAANTVLVKYYNKLGCIIVNKNEYSGTLNSLLQHNNSVRKNNSGKIKLSRLYYNNGCNRVCKQYCSSARQLGFGCNRKTSTRGTKANLTNLYRDSILSKPLLRLRDQSKVETLESLLN